MSKLQVLAFLMVLTFCGAVCSALTPQQNNRKSMDWKEELRKAQAGIKENPKSAFWHNQAGVAYDALRDAENAGKELRLAATLDSTNPVGYYTLYAFYQRNGTLAQQRQALLLALGIDSRNPLGHFELAEVLDKEGHLTNALKEYRTARQIVSETEGLEYLDPRGNPYEIEVVRTQVDQRIDKIEKLTTQQRKD